MKRARFIAGARCQTCGEIDRIVVEESPDGRTQRCVACGHREAQPNEATNVTIKRVATGGGSDTKNH